MTAGLSAADAESAIEDLLQNLRDAIDRVALPEAIELPGDSRKILAEMRGICSRRIEAMT